MSGRGALVLRVVKHLAIGMFAFGLIHVFPLVVRDTPLVLFLPEVLISGDIVALSNRFPEDRVAKELGSVEETASLRDSRIARFVLVL